MAFRTVANFDVAKECGLFFVLVFLVVVTLLDWQRNILSRDLRYGLWMAL